MRSGWLDTMATLTAGFEGTEALGIGYERRQLSPPAHATVSHSIAAC